MADYIFDLMDEAEAIFKKWDHNVPTYSLRAKATLGYLHALYESYVDAKNCVRRYYHNYSHIIDCYRILKDAKEDLGLFQDEYEEILLAILFHDVVYHVGSEKNEEKSVRAFHIFCTNYNIDLETPWVKKVSNMIMQTKHIGIEYTNRYCDGIMRDIDLVGIGSDWEVFQENGEMIRKEFKMYSDEDFNAGRIKFFEALAKQDRIYKNDYFYDKYEEQARENIQRELNILNNKETENE